MAKKKFDTNPLDPTFPDKIREAETRTLPKNDFSTNELPTSSAEENETRRFDRATEEQTRRFNENDFNAYQSPYSSQQVPTNYQRTNLAEMNESSSRIVEKIGISENILTAVPYIPAFVGMIAGILLLVFAPKSEAKVRFHAAQGLAAHLAILIVTTILGFVDNFSGVADTVNGVFQIVTTIMLIIFAVKAWQGKPVHIEWVDDLTEWLEEKITPRN